MVLVFWGLGLFSIKSFDLWRVLDMSRGARGGAGSDMVGRGWWFDRQAAWAEGHATLGRRGRRFGDFGRLILMMILPPDPLPLFVGIFDIRSIGAKHRTLLRY